VGEMGFWARKSYYITIPPSTVSTWPVM
jgi:hypothetical protein